MELAVAAAATASKNNAEMQQFQELQQQIELQRLQQSQQMFLHQQRIQEIQVNLNSLAHIFFTSEFLSLFGYQKVLHIFMTLFYETQREYNWIVSVTFFAENLYLFKWFPFKF